MTDAPKFVDPTYAKSGAYGETLADIIGRGVCPFCPDVFPGTWHKNPILNEIDGWRITRNFRPYENASEHLIMVGRRHLENIMDLTPEDSIAIVQLAQWATIEFQLPGGLLAMRFGDSKFTGATVKHLHAHLVVPRETDNKVAVVNFPIG